MFAPRNKRNIIYAVVGEHVNRKYSKLYQPLTNEVAPHW
jgi:hypothetical protein